MEKRFASHRPLTAKAPLPDSEADETSPADTKGVSKEPAKKAAANAPSPPKPPIAPKPREIGGPSGPEPTRYGDWERNGICYDF